LLILALKKYAEHNTITSINNSLMQSKIILIDIQVQNCFFEHVCNYFKKIAYFSKGVWGSAISSPSGVRGGVPEAKAFLGFYIASNPSKAVKNIIWLINL